VPGLGDIPLFGNLFKSEARSRKKTNLMVFLRPVVVRDGAATLHTNDAASAVNRLIDMGVEPFLLSSSLLGVLAQRLVRKRCTACHGAGCAACGQTGYAGRTGIFELLVATDEVRAQIHHRAAEAELRATALAQGMVLMRHDGQRLVDAGITSAEELLRVTRD
jgi:general secretion pathway protein E